MFTYHYSQPKAYRFSLDSIYFAAFVADEIGVQRNLSELSVLDLCAGCGVIGFEISWHLRELRHLHFMEVQSLYAEYFEQNIEIVNRPELNTVWHQQNYNVLAEPEWENQFDFIVSNPPYFLPQQGVLSPNEFKNRCRFFMDGSQESFIRGIANALKPGGKSYFLSRDNLEWQDYGIPFIEIRKVSQIRGTYVVMIQKDS